MKTIAHEFSREERFAEAEKLCLMLNEHMPSYSREFQVEEINRVVDGRGLMMPAAKAVPFLCALTRATAAMRYAVELIEKGAEIRAKNIMAIALDEIEAAK